MKVLKGRWTMFDFKKCKHVFKLDPHKPITDRDLEAICESATDAVVVGGTHGVTFDNTIDLLGRIRQYEVACLLEVSNHEAIVPGFDHYFIPFVLNARNPEWIIKPHHAVVKEMGSLIPWRDISVLGYCVLNPDSAVAQLTQSDTDIHRDDIVAYARMANHMFNIPLFYIEYSGDYGNPDLVQQVSQCLTREKDIHLFYGGGIRNKHQAHDMSANAQTIVVGNIIYEDIAAALETIPS